MKNTFDIKAGDNVEVIEISHNDYLKEGRVISTEHTTFNGDEVIVQVSFPNTSRYNLFYTHQLSSLKDKSYILNRFSDRYE